LVKVLSLDKTVVSVDSLCKGNRFNLIIKGFLNNFSVLNSRLVNRVIKERHGVLAPCFVITIGEVVSGVGTSRFFSVLGGEHGHLGLNHQVL